VAGGPALPAYPIFSSACSRSAHATSLIGPELGGRPAGKEAIDGVVTIAGGHYFGYPPDHGLLTMGDPMREQVSKSQFKAKALELFRAVETTGEPVIVTDHGRPTIEVRRYRTVDRDPMEVLRGSVTEYVCPTEPVGESDWEASR
jgi:hypothetical protein